MRQTRREWRVSFVVLMTIAWSLTTNNAGAEPEPQAGTPSATLTTNSTRSTNEDAWGRWAPADKDLLPFDFRMGFHMTHMSIASTSVGDGKRGVDYGFRSPRVYVPELAFSAFTSRHLSFGLVMQVMSFGSQDAPLSDPQSARYTRSPMVMGIGALIEGGYSAGPVLFRPGVATGPRAIMLIEDRSGKQSPPVGAQWFMHVRGAAELEVTRSFAIGVGASTDVLRPLDWGAFAYLVWRLNDVRGATN